MSVGAEVGIMLSTAMRTGAGILLSWLMLLAAAVAGPALAASPALGDDRTRYTVRVALLYYAAACTLWLTGLDRPARLCWALGLIAYLIHLGTAFHYYHGWSHAAAVAHTKERSGFGEGIYVSHLFTLVWLADVAASWAAPMWYKTRPRWLVAAVHGFMLFVAFNATVVYETGFIRWAGLGTVLVLASVWVYSRLPVRSV